MSQKAEKKNGTEYSLRRKLISQGGGFVVSIPRWLATAKGLSEGDFINLKFNSHSGLIIEKAEETEEKR